MPDPDPENVRFYRSGAQTPSYDQITERDPDLDEPNPPTVYRGGSPDPGELALARARIYRPSPSPVQGGRARAHEWMVEFEPQLKPGIDPLMGWISSADPLQQVRLRFASLDDALAYCRRQRLPFDLDLPRPHRPVRRTYTDNFTPSADGGAKTVYPH